MSKLWLLVLFVSMSVSAYDWPDWVVGGLEEAKELCEKPETDEFDVLTFAPDDSNQRFLISCKSLLKLLKEEEEVPDSI